MKKSGEDIKQQLQAIRQSYCASLPERMDRIQTLWQSLCNGGTEQDYEEFYRLVHSLAGSAETFELKQLGDCARSIVQQLKHSRAATHWPDLAASITTLEKSIQAAKR